MLKYLRKNLEYLGDAEAQQHFLKRFQALRRGKEFLGHKIFDGHIQVYVHVYAWQDTLERVDTHVNNITFHKKDKRNEPWRFMEYLFNGFGRLLSHDGSCPEDVLRPLVERDPTIREYIKKLHEDVKIFIRDLKNQLKSTIPDANSLHVKEMILILENYSPNLTRRGW